MTTFISEYWLQIVTVFFILLFICIGLLRYSCDYEEVIWFPKHLLPNRIENQDYSEDVLIYDYDTKKSNIAYYNFKEEVWKTINYQDLPENFKWRSLEIEMN